MTPNATTSEPTGTATDSHHGCSSRRSILISASRPAMRNPISSTVAAAASSSATTRALVHDGDPVGEREDLVEVLADHEHSHAVGGRPAEVRVNGLDRADVEAARRLSGDEHDRLPLELAAEHELLEVPAGEVARRGVGAGRLDVVSRYERARDLRHASEPEHRPT